MGVTGRILPPYILILSMRVFDPRDSAYAVTLTYDRHSYVTGFAETRLIFGVRNCIAIARFRQLSKFLSIFFLVHKLG